jgi:hypothetical protein
VTWGLQLFPGILPEALCICVGGIEGVGVAGYTWLTERCRGRLPLHRSYSDSLFLNTPRRVHSPHTHTQTTLFTTTVCPFRGKETLTDRYPIVSFLDFILWLSTRYFLEIASQFCRCINTHFKNLPSWFFVSCGSISSSNFKYRILRSLYELLYPTSCDICWHFIWTT